MRKPFPTFDRVAAALAVAIAIVATLVVTLPPTVCAGVVSAPAVVGGTASVPTNAQFATMRVFGPLTNEAQWFGPNYYQQEASGIFQLIDYPRSVPVVTVESSDGRITFGAAGATPGIEIPTPLFSQSHFVGSGTSILSGPIRMPGIATNRVPFLDGNSNLTGLAIGSGLQLSGGTLAVSGGGGGSGASDGNFDVVTITNSLLELVHDAGETTNLVLPVTATNAVVWSPAGNCALTLSGSWPTGFRKRINLTLVLTNGQTSVVLPLAGPNGERVGIKTAPSTNLLAIVSDGARQWIESSITPDIEARGVYRWKDGTLSRDVFDTEFLTTFSTSAIGPDGEIAYTASGGAVNPSSGGFATGSRLGGLGGIVSLRQWQTNVFSSAAVAFGGFGAAFPTLLLTTNTFFAATVGFDNTSTSLTNCLAQIGAVSRADTNAIQSGVLWTLNTLITNVWGAVTMNLGTAATNWVGPPIMTTSNALATLDWVIDDSIAVVFRTNGIPVVTNSTAGTIPTNAPMIFVARFSPAFSNANLVAQQYLLGVDRLRLNIK